ncbi:MAG TPA: hypothetical protein VHV30_16140 [Polyangiaceae bacterium]|jgi:hypothetical protein|nr:hypothetical protein [Polyangiaceae bacterium]
MNRLTDSRASRAGSRWKSYAIPFAALIASACSGAAHDSLDDPPGVSPAEDASAAPTTPVPEAAPAGDTVDATTSDDTSSDAGADDVDDAGDLDAAPVVEAGRDASDASLCGPCAGLGQKCCETPNTISYRQCYSPAICPGCCF